MFHLFSLASKVLRTRSFLQLFFHQVDFHLQWVSLVQLLVVLLLHLVNLFFQFRNSLWKLLLSVFQLFRVDFWGFQSLRKGVWKDYFIWSSLMCLQFGTFFLQNSDGLFSNLIVYFQVFILVSHLLNLLSELVTIWLQLVQNKCWPLLKNFFFLRLRQFLVISEQIFLMQIALSILLFLVCFLCHFGVCNSWPFYQLFIYQILKLIAPVLHFVQGLYVLPTLLGQMIELQVLLSQHFIIIFCYFQFLSQLVVLLPALAQLYLGRLMIFLGDRNLFSQAITQYL